MTKATLPREFRRGATVGVLAATALGAGALPAHARTTHQVKPAHFSYRIAGATHTSKAEGYDPGPPAYAAHAGSSWRLAKATKRAPNRIGGDYTRLGVLGGGTMSLRGTYAADASGPRGHCALSAPTGSTEYAMVAPGPDALSVAGGPRGLTVRLGTFGGGSSIATGPSGGGYFDADCLGGGWEVPSDAIDDARTTRVSYTTFRHKTITLRFKGGYTAARNSANWSTTIVLKRVDPKPRRHRRHHH